MSRSSSELPDTGLKKTIDEKLLREMEVVFLEKFISVLQDRNRIDDAVIGRECIRRGKNSLNLSNYLKEKDPVKEEAKITIDPRIKSGGLRQMGLNEGLAKSLEKNEVARIVLASTVFSEVSSIIEDAKNKPEDVLVTILEKINDTANQAKINVLNKIDIFKIKSNEDFVASDDTIKALKTTLDEFKLSQLKTKIDSAANEYYSMSSDKLLGQQHGSQFFELQTFLKRDQKMNLDDVIQELEARFKAQFEVKNFLGKRVYKEPSQFIDYLNNSPDKSHYSRLLGFLLKEAYAIRKHEGDEYAFGLNKLKIPEESVHKKIYNELFPLPQSSPQLSSKRQLQ